MPKHDWNRRRTGMMHHACKRARERWGANLTVDDIEGLNAVIRMGLGRQMDLGSRKPNGEKFIVTTLDRQRLPVVYHKKYKTVVTVLDHHAPEVVRAMAKRHRLNRSTLNLARGPQESHSR